MHRAPATLVLSTLLSGISTQASHATDIGPVGELVSQRLSYMQNVALYKQAHHIPVEDLAQEARVMERSLQQAESFGLDRDSVKSFIDAQMRAAKAVQYRYRADWLFTNKLPAPPQTLDATRKEIEALGGEILELLATRLKQGITIDERDGPEFGTQLSGYSLLDIEKNQLFETLRQVRLSRS